MNVKELARYIINHCLEIGKPISNLRLQKILYFVEGEYYKQKKYWLTDADFYAWPFGPVNREVYGEYYVYGGGLIYEQPMGFVDENVKNVIDPIIEKYANMSTTDLVNFSHKNGGAWKLSYDGNKNTKINKLFMQNEFKVGQ